MLIKCAIRRNDKSNKRMERLNERGSKNDKRKKKNKKRKYKNNERELSIVLKPTATPTEKNVAKFIEN